MRKWIRRSARYARALALFSSGMLWLAKRRARVRGEVVVVTFHRVLNDAEFDGTSSLPGICVRERTFNSFAAWAAKAFDVVDTSTAADVVGTPSKRVRAAVTFDDGWLDTYKHAYPIAAKYGIPFTVFVCSGLSGRTLPFWPERVALLLRNAPEPGLEPVIERLKNLDTAERENEIAKISSRAGVRELTGLLSNAAAHEPMNQLMTWDEVAALSRQGVQIGSHTVSHAILTGVPREEVDLELSNSRIQIERSLGIACKAISYPNGNINLSIRDQAKQSGYNIAFTTRPGYWGRATDRLQIPRVNLWEGKLVGPRGRFSRVMTEYSLFWSLPRSRSSEIR